MRIKHQREHYIPKGAAKFADRKSSAVVYAYSKNGKPYLLGFHGRAQKPDFHYRYDNDAQRQDQAKRHFKRWQDNEASVRRKPRSLVVGDVLRASWGYDQTNIDFYQVVALIGAQMVEIRELAQEREATEFMQGRCVPLVGQFVGEPMRKRADGDCVKIASYAFAFKIEPRIDGGVSAYDSARFTEYA